MQDEAPSGIGSRVARVIALSWLVAIAVYLGTCAAYRPLGFRAIEASRFGFRATSLICLGALLGVAGILFRTKPGVPVVAASLVGTLASAVLLSLLMVMCYMP